MPTRALSSGTATFTLEHRLILRGGFILAESSGLEMQAELRLRNSGRRFMFCEIHQLPRSAVLASLCPNCTRTSSSMDVVECAITIEIRSGRLLRKRRILSPTRTIRCLSNHLAMQVSTSRMWNHSPCISTPLAQHYMLLKNKVVCAQFARDW